jgi:hypothetical protein
LFSIPSPHQADSFVRAFSEIMRGFWRGLAGPNALNSAHKFHFRGEKKSGWGHETLIIIIIIITWLFTMVTAGLHPRAWKMCTGKKTACFHNLVSASLSAHFRQMSKSTFSPGTVPVDVQKDCKCGGKQLLWQFLSSLFLPLQNEFFRC